MIQSGAVQPTIGRIVHYQAYGTPGGEYPFVPRAAIVTDVLSDEFTDNNKDRQLDGEGEWQPDVSLCVLNPTGTFFNQRVPYSASRKPGCWSWPPRTNGV